MNLQICYKILKSKSSFFQYLFCLHTPNHLISMIKDVLISRFSDGTIFCEASQANNNNQLQDVRVKIKSYHRQVTPYNKSEQSTTMRQIQNRTFGIYYKINSYVVFTVIVELGYPLKLTNVFIDTIASSFFDQAKTILGSHDLPSRLESVQGSHYFVKFDRVIKQKKRQFDDPKSMKNTQRMKKELQSIQQIMKQNLNMIDTRHKQLLQTQQKARKVNQQSKIFQRNSKKLKWNIWFKKNLIWIVLIITVIVLGWIII